MDRQKFLTMILSEPGVSELVSQLKSAPTKKTAVAALERMRDQLFSLHGKYRDVLEASSPIFNPALYKIWNSLICEIWNSLRDVEARGLTEADDFLIYVLIGANGEQNRCPDRIAIASPS